jgi:hypothetical protein
LITFLIIEPSEWGLYASCMLVYIIEKFIFTALTLSCPVPGGIFTPSFALGAVLGQLYVQIVMGISTELGFDTLIKCKYLDNNSYFRLSQGNLLHPGCCSNDKQRYSDDLRSYHSSRAKWTFELRRANYGLRS